MAKPNYAFQKRQRELAKKQKKEEKRQRRVESPSAEAGMPAIDGQVDEPGSTPASSGAPETSAGS